MTDPVITALGVVVAVVLGAVLGAAAAPFAMAATYACGLRAVERLPRSAVARLVDTEPEAVPSKWALPAEVTVYVGLGALYVLVVGVLSAADVFPTFYGALSYSSAAVDALVAYTAGFVAVTWLLAVVGVGTLAPDLRADLSVHGGLAAGLLTFGAFAWSGLLRVMYGDLATEVGRRVELGNWLTVNAVVLSWPWVAAVVGLAVVALILRRASTSLRPGSWHFAVLVGGTGVAAFFGVELLAWATLEAGGLLPLSVLRVAWYGKVLVLLGAFCAVGAAE